MPRALYHLDSKFLVHASREAPLPPYHILKRTGSRLSRAACRTSRLGSAATYGAIDNLLIIVTLYLADEIGTVAA